MRTASGWTEEDGLRALAQEPDDETREELLKGFPQLLAQGWPVSEALVKCFEIAAETEETMNLLGGAPTIWY